MCETLICIGPAAKATVPALIEIVRNSEDRDVRNQAITALGNMAHEGKPAVPVLVDALRDKDDGEVNLVAVYALGRIGRPAVTTLIEKLSHPDSTVREGAAMALGKMGREAEEAIPSLVQAFYDKDKGAYDEDKEARNEAARAYWNIVFPGFLHQPKPLSETLSLVRRERHARDLFAKLLTKLDIDIDDGVEAALVEMYTSRIPELIDALDKSGGRAREAGVVGLRRIGPRAKAASAALRACYDDEDVFVRMNAAAAILVIHGEEPAALTILTNALKQPDDWVRREAAMLLDEAGLAAKPAAPALRDAFSDPVAGVRRRIAEALVEIEPDNTTPISMLISLLDDDNDTGDPAFERMFAAETLRKLGVRAKAAVPHLQRIRIIDPDGRVRREAKEALRRIQWAIRHQPTASD